MRTKGANTDRGSWLEHLKGAKSFACKKHLSTQSVRRILTGPLGVRAVALIPAPRADELAVSLEHRGAAEVALQGG